MHYILTLNGSGARMTASSVKLMDKGEEELFRWMTLQEVPSP